MAVTPDDFKGALRRFASGVTVVAVRSQDADLGMTASAFTSVSLTPPRVLVCVQKAAHLHDALLAAGSFAVTVLAEPQQELSNRFAGRASGDEDRFAELKVERAPGSGALWFEGGLAWIDCALAAAHDGGDHTIFVGDVVHARHASDIPAEQALLYAAGRYRKVGDAL